MLSTVNSVKEYTGYDVTLDLIKRAQAVIEIYVGKDEVDIDSPSDLLLLEFMISHPIWSKTLRSPSLSSL